MNAPSRFISNFPIPKKIIIPIAGLFLGMAFFSVFLFAEAVVVITPATGGAAISADTTGGTYTALTGPAISEGLAGDVGTGTIILNVPSGFIFDTGGVAPTVLVTRISGNGPDTRNINDLASGSTIAATRTSTQLTITITAASSNGVRNSLTWQNVRVRPSAGTPLATGNITKSGTSVISGVTNGTTNLGTLTEVVGAKSQLVITTQPSASASTATDFSVKPIVALRDQFGNTLTTDNSTTITRTVVLSTQVCGGTAGSGTLSSTPANGAVVSAGVMTYSAMQYSAGESIKICFSSMGVTSALSSAITVSVPTDTTAPAAISDLVASGATNSSIDLTWSATGDDGSVGTATSYDVRYSTSIINAGNWSSATQATGEPTPQTAGTSQNMSISGLSPNTTYYFAIKVLDEASNSSDISNVVSLATTATPDTTSPASVSDLTVSNPTQGSLTVSWTSPGDDANSGTATSYDLRYSTPPITAGNFSSATQVTGEPTPQVAGTSQNMTVTGLSPNTTYYFAIQTSDEIPNTSTISNVASGTTQSASTPPNQANASSSESYSRQPDTTTASFEGLAFPNGFIEFFQRNRLGLVSEETPIASSTVESDGSFFISIPKLIFGDYLFSLTAIDEQGRNGGISAFNADFLFGKESLEVKNIFVAPTVEINKAVIPFGSDFNIKGAASPNALVNIFIDDKLRSTIESDDSGNYYFVTSSLSLSLGTHRVKVRQIAQTTTTVDNGRVSGFSQSKIFKTSTLLIPLADLNNDNAVDISDWSIFLFSWGSRDSKIRAKIDLDGNGKINISDLSIFLRLIKTTK